MNKNKQIQDLSNVYVTLQDIEVKGRFSTPMAMCLKTLEDVIYSLKEESANKETQGKE